MALAGDATAEGTALWRRTLERVARRVGSAAPVLEYGTCCGVRVSRPAEPRRLFDPFRPGRSTPEHSSFEGGLVSVHREHTRAGDDVVVVGGGYGITTVVAARRADSVTVYEASERRLRTLRHTLALNEIEPDAVATSRAIVGALAPAEADEKGLDARDVPTHPADELPPCDVLELDCEGAELAILRGLDRSALPRVLAVEIHPIKLDGAAGEVVPTVEAMGYEIDRRLTHDGIAISREPFEDLLRGETPGVGGEDHQEFPPVVVARHPSADRELQD